MTDLLKKLTTIIMAGGKGERLFPLTRDKAKPAITFGSLYRIIDFTLSNCLNSGIRRIYILTQYGSFSLDQHLRQAWDIMHPDLGEFIYSMPPQQIMVSRWYRGTADSIFQNLNLLEAERPKHVLILSGDHVYKMDYGRMLAQHVSRKADLTVACIEVPIEELDGRTLGLSSASQTSVVLLKMLVLAYLYNVSERRVAEYVADSISAKWFLGLAADEPAPDHSTLTKLKERIRDGGQERCLQAILDAVVREAVQQGVAFGSVQIVDSTHTQSNVNREKDEARKNEGQPPRDGAQPGGRASGC